jgi:hypothetical protein
MLIEYIEDDVEKFPFEQMREAEAIMGTSLLDLDESSQSPLPTASL